MKRQNFPARLASLLLALALFLTACQSGTSAASMFLQKTEGTVEVSDDKGQSVSLVEKLGLYNGYGIDTEATSYAWIDLDEVKLAKMDENSEISITKDGKKLSIDVKSGSLFFNVTEPLAEDETMNIRTSSMMVGIRGTCGWVEVPDSDTMRVYLLEGKVECTVGEKTSTVAAGEMAAMTADGEITVEPFSALDLPAFVIQEIEADENLNRAVLDASGIDVAGNPLTDYADIFARLRADRNQILFAEVLDLEADGNPELLVLTSSPEGDGEWNIHPHIYREGPDGAVKWLRSGGSLLEKNAIGDISLVESGGRLYIRSCRHLEIATPYNDWIRDYYWGSVALQDGLPDDWNYIEELQLGSDESGVSCFRQYRDERGLCARPPYDGYDESISTAEYEAIQTSYREVKVLISSPDGKTLVVSPDP